MQIYFRYWQRTCRAALAGLVVLAGWAQIAHALPPQAGCGSISSANGSNTATAQATLAFNGGEILTVEISDNSNAIGIDVRAVGGAIVLREQGISVPPTIVRTLTILSAGDYELEVGSNLSQIIATITWTCSASAAVSDKAVINAFLQNRVNGLIANEPGGTSLLQRGATGVAGAAGVGFSNSTGASEPMGLTRATGIHGSPKASGHAFGSTDEVPGTRSQQFRTSLSEMARLAMAQTDKQQDAALGLARTGLPGVQIAPSPFDIWVEGRYLGYGDDAAGLDRKGHLGVVYLGADYRMHRDLLVGALVQFDWSREKSATLQSDIDGAGWMAGPYLSIRLMPNIYFDARAAWGRSANDLTLGSTTGDFDTDRWLAKARLSGNWTRGPWRLTPSLEVAYAEERQKAYINSAATAVPGQTVSLGRATFGPEIGYKFLAPGRVLVEPHVSLMGVWDFDRPDATVVNDLLVGSDGLRGKIEAGVLVVMPDGWSWRTAASYDGIGSGSYHGYTVQTLMSIPLN